MDIQINLKNIPLNLPSPVQEIDFFPFRCSIKRDDLIHPEISGNKYRKLKYIIAQNQQQIKGILTFGGAFSNHIYAVAALSQYLGIPSVAIIRGENDKANPTLLFASKAGMVFHFVNRAVYRDKKHAMILEIMSMYPDYLMIPEGGDHAHAYRGVEEMLDELNEVPDYIAVSVGTGTTAASIIQGILFRKWNTRLLAFSSMKNNSLRRSILQKINLEDTDQLILIEEYHMGGYAKWNKELITFIEYFFQSTGILLDPIYTGKMVFGINDLIKNNFFETSDHVLLYHSGGLQGWAGWNYLHHKKK